MMKLLMMCMHFVLVANGMQGPQAWMGKDIGKVTTPGTASQDGVMAWVVQGSGEDIHGAADSFRYVYRPLEGDGAIIAKVDTLDATDPWAKAGVMIREDLEPGSRFAAVCATPFNGVCVQGRLKPGGAAVSDTTVKSKEQRSLKAPVWIKLERKEDLFSGYYAVDEPGAVWRPSVWEPQKISMPKKVWVGMAVCSHAPKVLCEARFASVAVSDAGAGIPAIGMLANPKHALGRAYENLEQLGNWRQDGQTLKKHKDLIASSLLAIAKARELNGEPASVVLPDYYRITDVLPDSPFVVDALTRVAILDGQKGLKYAAERMNARSPEERDRFHVAVVNGYSSEPNTPEAEAAIRSFVRHVAEHSRYSLFEDVITGLGDGKQTLLACKCLIQQGMAEPSTVKTAVVGLRYMALKASRGQASIPIKELSEWAASQFKDPRLTACAMAVLADTYYERRLYVKALEVYQPRLLSGTSSESKKVEHIENALASYRANTLLQTTIDPKRIYDALGEEAGKLGLNTVALHCQRKIAQTTGLSLDGFERSASQGVKFCNSGPENEVWFWRGLAAAGDMDLGSAAAAYERFVQEDGNSVLAARAYYDIARAKMAVGDDARGWIAKAKALSPCDSVIRLERQLGTTFAQ